MKPISAFHSKGISSRIRIKYTYRIRYGIPNKSKVKYHANMNRETHKKDLEYWGKPFLKYFRFRYSRIWGF